MVFLFMVFLFINVGGYTLLGEREMALRHRAM